MAKQPVESTTVDLVGGEPKRLTALEILDIDDRIQEDVIVPEWKAIVTVRSMTGTERDRLEASMVDTRGTRREINLRNMRARTVAASAIDPATGKLLFTAEQIDALGRKNASAIQRLFNVAQRLSGFTDQDIKELTVELGKDPSDDSGSN